MLQQVPPAFKYSTAQVFNQNMIRPVAKAPNFGQAMHWLVGAWNWTVNQRKIRGEMVRIERELLQQVTDTQGVLIIQIFDRPPKLSGNADKPMFRSLGIAGRGCSMQEALDVYRQPKPTMVSMPSGRYTEAKPEGWTIEERFVWVTKL
ncbi:hypothetical protein KUV51_00040 [Tateyamaria omphalii]|uniref:hypothetical protein n=1 Tax=Tateyamaria omphalii TaxID=299262 RepID=UPI001C9909DE|nr:hypothetical protein [Tateyamaria omphalii]MBY5931370.1 hypothetical protein [Tateyamaria omphalii]